MQLIVLFLPDYSTLPTFFGHKSSRSYPKISRSDSYEAPTPKAKTYKKNYLKPYFTFENFDVSLEDAESSDTEEKQPPVPTPKPTTTTTEDSVVAVVDIRTVSEPDTIEDNIVVDDDLEAEDTTEVLVDV